jgi:hypothetical protein
VGTGGVYTEVFGLASKKSQKIDFSSKKMWQWHNSFRNEGVKQRLALT